MSDGDEKGKDLKDLVKKSGKSRDRMTENSEPIKKRKDSSSETTDTGPEYDPGNDN